MNFEHIGILTAFLAGIGSFLSPCVLPILPLYFGYLTGNCKEKVGDEIVYKRGKVILNTVSFILGISVVYFILGFSMTTVASYLQSNKIIIAKISGVIVFILGLFQLGIIKFNFLMRERRVDIETKGMNPIVAFIMGFTFSFAWTPCIGPVLAGILAVAGNVGIGNRMEGMMLIMFYSLGLCIPFLLLGIFTTKGLNFFKKNQKIVLYTSKISGVVLMVVGVLTFFGYFTPTYSKQPTEKVQTTQKQPTIEEITFYDQYGKKHSLKEYKGKVVFLNFWASWCPPCNHELPDVEALYKEMGYNKKDVVVLGVVNPSDGVSPSAEQIDATEMKKFIAKKGLTFPVLFDVSGIYMSYFMIDAFPTTYIIGKDGKVVKKIQGMIPKDEMVRVINNAK